MRNFVRLALFAIAIYVPQHAHGCTIPVFRYALEKWELTPYEIMVYHRGPLPKDIAAALKQWSDAPNKANLDITLIDLDGKLTPKQQKLWKCDDDSDQTPFMMVRPQNADPSESSAWLGPCTVANLHSVLDSPMRQTILAHLTRGASTVWVLLASGDAKADQAVCALAMKELQLLEKRIKLPAQSDEGPKIQLPLPLKVSFPLIVLDRNRPDEAAFIRLLLATEERLTDMKGPILFPIFGRGRLLGSLCDQKKEITPEQIADVAKFLCRECSCQVKELNPGMDLLFVADWRDHFDKIYEGKEPVLMPPMMPASFVTSSVLVPAVNPNDVQPILVKTGPILTKDATAPAKSDSGFTLSPTPAPAPIQVVTVEAKFAPACCDLRMWLWMATGFAAGLVLMTGGWAVCHLRK